MNPHVHNCDKNQHAIVIVLTWVITVVDPSFLQVGVVPPVVAGRHGGLSWGWDWGCRRPLGMACGLAWDRRGTCSEGQG